MAWPWTWRRTLWCSTALRAPVSAPASSLRAGWRSTAGGDRRTAPLRSSRACHFRRTGISCSSSIPSTADVHGSEEISAFGELPEFSAALAGHLCRLALMQALPAVAERDLSAFGRAVTEIQMHIGDYFGAAQGGRFASRDVARRPRNSSRRTASRATARAHGVRPASPSPPRARKHAGCRTWPPAQRLRAASSCRS